MDNTSKKGEQSIEDVVEAVRDEVRQALDLLERKKTVSAAIKLLVLRQQLDRMLKNRNAGPVAGLGER